MENELSYEIIKRGEKDFPIKLYDLKDCPKELYIIGNKKLLDDFSIAIVGARECLDKSREITYETSYNLAMCGVTIISGLARGIDKAAHEGALKANGKTIAVLSGGFENLYPKENIGILYEIIEKNGLIITEYPPKMPCLKPNFVLRNRIIAALSKRNNCCTS